jgi:maleate isomerase
MLARHARESRTRFTFHSSRAVLHEVTKESLDRMVDDGERCARELSDARVDALVYACLIAVMAQGAGAHDAVEARLAEAARSNGAPMPVISSAGALVRAVHRLPATRVAIITPYVQSLTQLVVDYLAANEIEVVDAISLKVSNNVAVGRLDPQQLIPLARRLDTSNADAVILSACVQMPSLPVIERVEQELGIPVLSAATATVFDLLGAIDVEPRVPGAGSLLAGEQATIATDSG